MDVFVQVLAAALTTGAIYGLLASGFGLALGTMGIVDFTYGIYVVLGAVVAASLPSFATGWADLGLRLAIAMLASGLLATLVYVAFLIRMIPRGHLVQLIATLGGALLLQGVLHFAFGPDLISSKTKIFPGALELGGAVVTHQRLLAAVLGLVSMAVLGLILARTPLGKSWRAVAVNPAGAVLSGLSLTRLRLAAGAASGALAGLAGGLLVQIVSVDVFQGLPYLIIAFFVVALGGMGSTVGQMIAAFAFATIQAMSDIYAPELVKTSSVYILVMLAITFLPRGVASFWSARERVA